MCQDVTKIRRLGLDPAPMHTRCLINPVRPANTRLPTSFQMLESTTAFPKPRNLRSHALDKVYEFYGIVPVKNGSIQIAQQRSTSCLGHHSASEAIDSRWVIVNTVVIAIARIAQSVALRQRCQHLDHLAFAVQFTCTVT